MHSLIAPRNIFIYTFSSVLVCILFGLFILFPTHTTHAQTSNVYNTTQLHGFLVELLQKYGITDSSSLNNRPAYHHGQGPFYSRATNLNEYIYTEAGTGHVASTSELGIGVGDTVVTTSNLSIRDYPAGDGVGVAREGTIGRAVSGPRFSDGREWWKISYDVIGLSGWSAAGWLRVTARAIPTGIQAKDDPELDILVEDMTVTLSYTSDCVWYTVDWDDGTSDEAGSSIFTRLNDDCKGSQDSVEIEHTYSTEGTYYIQMFGNIGSTVVITVPAEVDESEDEDEDDDENHEWTIDDVVDISSASVDPIRLSVSDEYTRYTIVLDNGDRIVLKTCDLCEAAYFNEPFYDAGYSGDVNDLVELNQSLSDNPFLRVKGVSTSTVDSNSTRADVAAERLKLIEKIYEMQERIGEARGEFQAEQAELKAEMRQTSTETKADIAQVKVDFLNSLNDLSDEEKRAALKERIAEFRAQIEARKKAAEKVHDSAKEEAHTMRDRIREAHKNFLEAIKELEGEEKRSVVLEYLTDLRTIIAERAAGLSSQLDILENDDDADESEDKTEDESDKDEDESEEMGDSDEDEDNSDDDSDDDTDNS